MKLKRTPWYPATMNPATPGPYECERSEIVCQRKPKTKRVIRMLEWDGEHWRYGKSVPNENCKPGMLALMHPEYGDCWRGVEQPS